MIARRVIIQGVVQGVGFRAWTEREAKLRNLKGWVRNLSDGRVESIVQGEDSMVEEMLQAFRRGPKYAEVSEVEVTEAGVEEFGGFWIEETE